MTGNGASAFTAFASGLISGRVFRQMIDVMLVAVYMTDAARHPIARNAWPNGRTERGSGLHHTPQCCAIRGGKVIAGINILVDISDRKKAEMEAND